jgi:hypothetical protein
LVKGLVAEGGRRCKGWISIEGLIWRRDVSRSLAWRGVVRLKGLLWASYERVVAV